MAGEIVVREEVEKDEKPKPARRGAMIESVSNAQLGHYKGRPVHVDVGDFIQFPSNLDRDYRAPSEGWMATATILYGRVVKILYDEVSKDFKLEVYKYVPRAEVDGAIKSAAVASKQAVPHQRELIRYADDKACFARLKIIDPDHPWPLHSGVEVIKVATRKTFNRLCVSNSERTKQQNQARLTNPKSKKGRPVKLKPVELPERLYFASRAWDHRTFTLKDATEDDAMFEGKVPKVEDLIKLNSGLVKLGIVLKEKWEEERAKKALRTATKKSQAKRKRLEESSDEEESVGAARAREDIEREGDENDEPEQEEEEEKPAEGEEEEEEEPLNVPPVRRGRRSAPAARAPSPKQAKIEVGAGKRRRRA